MNSYGLYTQLFVRGMYAFLLFSIYAPGCIPWKLDAEVAPRIKCVSTSNAEKSLMHTKNLQAEVRGLCVHGPL